MKKRDTDPYSDDEGISVFDALFRNYDSIIYKNIENGKWKASTSTC